MNRNHFAVALTSLSFVCVALLVVQRDSNSQTKTSSEQKINEHTADLIAPLADKWKTYHQKIKTIDVTWTLKPRNGLTLEQYLGASEAKTNTTDWQEKTRFVLDGKKFHSEIWEPRVIATDKAQIITTYDGKNYQQLNESLVLSEATTLPSHIPYKRLPFHLQLFSFALQGPAKESSTISDFQNEVTWQLMSKIVKHAENIDKEGKKQTTFVIDTQDEPLEISVLVNAENDLPQQWQSKNKATGDVSSNGRVESFITVGEGENSVTLPAKWSYELIFGDQHKDFVGEIDVKTLRVNQLIDPQLFKVIPRSSRTKSHFNCATSIFFSALYSKG